MRRSLIVTRRRRILALAGRTGRRHAGRRDKMRSTGLAAALFGVALAAAGCVRIDTAGSAQPDLAVLPAGQPATTITYLQAAGAAVSAEQPQRATAALDRAETLLLDTAPPPAPFGVPQDPPVIRQIARAREAIMYRHWREAQTYISEALQHPYIDR